jgi:hypothetical protein
MGYEHFLILLEHFEVGLPGLKRLCPWGLKIPVFLSRGLNGGDFSSEGLLKPVRWGLIKVEGSKLGCANQGAWVSLRCPGRFRGWLGAASMRVGVSGLKHAGNAQFPI